MAAIEQTVDNLVRPIAGQYAPYIGVAAAGAGAGFAATWALGFIVARAAPPADRNATVSNVLANLGEGGASAAVGASVGILMRMIDGPMPVTSAVLAGAGTSLALRMAFM